jgi:serine/threonine-protein kinase
MPGNEALKVRAERLPAPSRQFLSLVRSRPVLRLASPGPGRTPLDSRPEIEPTAEYTSCQALESGAVERGAEAESSGQGRLRTAVGLLFLMVCGLYARSLLAPERVATFGMIHAGVLMGLGVLFGVLSPRRLRSGRVLRAVELAAFGLALVLIGTAQYGRTLLGLQQDNPALAVSALRSSVLATFGVMVLHGLFVPSGWRRAALVVGSMALMPPAIALTLLLRHPELDAVAARLANVEQASENVLMLGFGAVVSVLGAHRRGGPRDDRADSQTFGPYRLRKRIGTGGMGEVYLAEHEHLKRLCAIKLIHPRRAAEPRVLARFEREVRATARLSHDNTVEIHDCGRTANGALYYVMEYLRGLNLAELVETYGPLPSGRVIHLLRQACQALIEVHAEGLIHRDIKPANLFAAYRGGRYDVAKILDFGLVKPAAEREESSAQVSRDGVITGSPLYMSPEQALGDPTDHRSDLYSLGAVGYFLLTGQPPFPGTSAVRVILAHAHEAIPPLSQHRPDIPDDLGRVILRCLAKKPADRFPDARSLDRALAFCADADGWTPEQAAHWWQETEERRSAIHG